MGTSGHSLGAFLANEEGWHMVTGISTDAWTGLLNLIVTCPAANIDKVVVYASPVDALKFLKDHERHTDFALVEVNMKEMHGFQFLDISRELHKNLQVISIEGKMGNAFGEGTKQKATHLMWTPFLQRKFLQAVELLGEAATPKKIQLLMNVNSVGRKQISAHLQKHRKKIEKELRNSNANKSSHGTLNSQPLRICGIGHNTFQYNPDIQPEDRSDEVVSLDHTEIIEETQSNMLYEAMRRALQLGTIFEESQLPNDPSGKDAGKVEIDMMRDGNYRDAGTYAFGDKNEVYETHNADDNAKVISKDDSDKLDSYGDELRPVVTLVTYSDSEEGETL
ncbi:two-component response regulator ORR29-like [Miscanthus floridulus]|uniref:two-component response regulator ORR29-like n=1 Tax=Miscanthus floridulus TaxID=154761 RepID=UPI00345AF347